MKPMVQKQTVASKNQLRFVLLTFFIFLVETTASFISMIQNDFLKYAPDGFLLVTIATSLLPALLFVLAFTFMKKSTLLRRLTQGIVWTFGGMLINVLATLALYVPSIINDGTDLVQLVYGPAIITIALYAIGLVIYRSNVAKTNKSLVPKWFEKVFIVLGFAYIASSLVLITREISMLGPLTDTYILYSLVPQALVLVLPVVGFFSLRVMKNKISRLYTVMLGVCFAFYVGTGLSQFGNVSQANDWTGTFLTVGSYVAITGVYIILLKRVHNRVINGEESGIVQGS